ncbi:MAG: S8 family serine peptidase [Planctomycetota bacterium]|nr:S8 family serine peptidase [Planctomycetota bacterium]
MRTTALLASGSSVLALVAATSNVAAQVQWRSGAPAAKIDPHRAADVLRAHARTASRVLVKLDKPPTDLVRADLLARGVSLLAPVGDTSFFASLRPGFGERAAASDRLVAAAPIDPDWKMHRDIREDTLPAWSLRGAAPNPEVVVCVVLHQDAPAGERGRDLLARHGGVVASVLTSVNALMAHVPRANLGALALEDDVQWIEPALPALGAMNAENRTRVQAAALQASPYNLSGQGVRALVFDAGRVRATHTDFGGRVVTLDASAPSSHATHCAGTLGGGGQSSAGLHRGMAPGVSILSAGLDLGPAGWLYTDPSDLEIDYAAAAALGVDLATNSLGTNVATNGFPCAWHGDYSTTDAVIDAIVRGSSPVTGYTPLRVVWAAGNERGSGRCGVSYATVAPPATAKNHLCVGSVDADTDLVSSFSAWGPTDDGRMKPDFCAPGCQSAGDAGVTSTTSDGDSAYGVMCGTSMATPTVAGSVALLLEDFRARFPGRPDPRTSTLKVLFAQSAVDRGNPGPDYQYGYGSVRAKDAIDLMRAGNFREAQAAQGQDVSYQVVVPAGSPALVLTLAWDDVPGTPNAARALVNDLDLEVYAPGGDRHFAWTLDPERPSMDAVRTRRNDLDNLEQVRVDAPAPGLWHIRVKAFDVPQGPQPFSLVSSHPLGSGPSFPTVAVLPADVVTLVPPLAPALVSADVLADNDVVVPGSVRLHYRLAPGLPFVSVPMVPVNATRWAGVLPGFECEGEVEYYFSAQGAQSGSAAAPSGGAASPLEAAVGIIETHVYFDMESDAGWTTGPDTAATGRWERANPEGTGAQPEHDTTGFGSACWVTGAAAGTSLGDFDIDTGRTILTSPRMNLTGLADATLTYSRWYSNSTGSAPNADTFVVQISPDDGVTWLPVETVGPSGIEAAGGWYTPAFRVGSLIANPGAQVRLRFIAEDGATPSVVEAAIDDLRVFTQVCSTEPPCDPDVNADGNVDQHDLACLAQVIGGSPACAGGSADADFNRDGNTDQGDLALLAQIIGGAPCP